MTFALSFVRLEEALKKPGCSVCRLGQDAAIHSVDSFLWEHTNDAEARKPINAANGFCIEHTRLLVATELSSSGVALGVNIIYELLAKNMSRQLKDLKKKRGGKKSAQTFLEKFGLKPSSQRNAPVLQALQACPVCIFVEGAEKNVLSSLFEELSSLRSSFRELYIHSSGICMRHLSVGLGYFASKFPHAADFLIEDAIQRMDTQQIEMLEYIRKQNWAYKEEKLTQDERTAWLRTLGFFTGLPQEKFSHIIDKF